MQPIERAPYPAQQVSWAAYLAALIIERAQMPGGSSSLSGDGSNASLSPARGQDESALIWVEGGIEPAREPVAGRRGLIFAAHCSGHGTTERVIIISFPVASDDGGPRVPAVSDVLETVGWSLRIGAGGMAAGGHTNTAVLVTRDREGLEQRLSLFEPVAAAEDRD